MTLMIELHDGSLQHLSDEMAAALYDELWSFAAQRGALSLVGKMAHELHKHASFRKSIVLDAAEDDVYWLAHEQVRKRLSTTPDHTVTGEPEKDSSKG